MKQYWLHYAIIAIFVVFVPFSVWLTFFEIGRHHTAFAVLDIFNVLLGTWNVAFNVRVLRRRKKNQAEIDRLEALYNAYTSTREK